MVTEILEMFLKACYPSGTHSWAHSQPLGAVRNAESQAPPATRIRGGRQVCKQATSVCQRVTGRVRVSAEGRVRGELTFGRDLEKDLFPQGCWSLLEAGAAWAKTEA